MSAAALGMSAAAPKMSAVAAGDVCCGSEDVCYGCGCRLLWVLPPGELWKAGEGVVVADLKRWDKFCSYLV